MHVDPSPPDPLAGFFEKLERESLVRLVLSKPRDSNANPADLVRVTVRPVVLKGGAQWSLVFTHATRDITKNLAPAEAVAQLRPLVADSFGAALLWTASEEIELLTSKKGRRTLLRRTRAAVAQDGAPVADESSAIAALAHDRAKHRSIDLARPFLTALGVTDAQQRLIPAMARKWKQINKFVEVLDHAISGTKLAQAARLDVVDFGSGKGYLTFATHEHLRHTLGLPAFTSGVELREDMVALCNAAAQSVGETGLQFEQGDVQSVAPDRIDVMIALHACDTATDHAIHTGVRAGASIIMCSPCCHKELRPQLLQPHPLRPILKHGVHLGQQAEMLTDGLRALALEACGYETQVFEFVSLEHTNKNKMILAVKRAHGAAPAETGRLWREVDELKSFYGVRDQCLETLLRGPHATIAADSSQPIFALHEST